MKNMRHISDEEIRRALRRFIKEGGLIHKLPDEVAPRMALVGSGHGMFENPMELYYLY